MDAMRYTVGFLFYHMSSGKGGDVDWQPHCQVGFQSGFQSLSIENVYES